MAAKLARKAVFSACRVVATYPAIYYQDGPHERALRFAAGRQCHASGVSAGEREVSWECQSRDEAEKLRDSILALKLMGMKVAIQAADAN